ncbi:TlpA disulfide reductase family protein [Flavobacterium subsaxonicum]|uniref:Thioredoxin domain-containing protein n=1 Tax=Flavobacterium subsaxonicum WB 4.1-42 = DSM 21790 TaxID=1121898 RepID=A0A0A2MQ48_9FLAO|nr:TlpA disulfide reductase family protein [Flavobacterium subsaxonicum]KGO93588.1 hypothetical protein Q766_06360 [Flavobacterium subsaxonicum WB 4.1-42 = DSM 21790]
MKKVVLFLAAAAMIVSCKQLAENEYEVTGTFADNSLDGKTIILEKQSQMGYTPVDTVKVDGDKFVIKGTTTDPEMVFLNVEGKTDSKVNFILEPGEINLKVDKDTLFKSVTGGTFNNDKLEEFKGLSYKMFKENEKIEKAALPQRNEALKINDTVTLNKLRKDKEASFKTWNGQLVDFIKKNPKAFVNIMVLGQVAQMRVSTMDDVRALFEGLDPSIKKTKEGKQIADYFAKMDAEKKGTPEAATSAEGGVKVGDAAPEFTAPSPEGKAVSLKQSLGKVTIIDFWASWCKPCRAENPNVVALYNELHAKGLNIIGVSLDKTADKWKEAIAADKLTWAHVSNLKFWDEPIAKQYGVSSIPATFILDASGKVVAKDLRGAELKAKVTELLGK